MSININDLSAKELAALISQAQKRKTTLNKRKPITTVRAKLTQQAKKDGYTIAELFGTGAPRASKDGAAKPAAGKKAGKKLGKVAPKYRNPANPAESWTGRGKQPRWLATLTTGGRKLEEFLIQ